MYYNDDMNAFAKCASISNTKTLHAVHSKLLNFNYSSISYIADIKVERLHAKRHDVTQNSFVWKVAGLSAGVLPGNNALSARCNQTMRVVVRRYGYLLEFCSPPL